MAITNRACACPYNIAYNSWDHVPECPNYPHGTPEVVPDRALELVPVTSDDAAVLAQIEGEPIFEDKRDAFEAELSRLVNFHSVEINTPDFLLAEFLNRVRSVFAETINKRDRWKNDNATVANFGFYVDGYTIHPTDSMEEIRVVAMDGRETIFPTKQLTAFLERRLSPPNIMPVN